MERDEATRLLAGRWLFRFDLSPPSHLILDFLGDRTDDLKGGLFYPKMRLCAFHLRLNDFHLACPNGSPKVEDARVELIDDETDYKFRILITLDLGTIDVTSCEMYVSQSAVGAVTR